MKRLVVVVCFAVLALSAAVWAADQQADLSGTWQQNAALSDAAPKNIDTSLTAGGGGGGGMGGGGGRGGGGGMGGFGGGMGGPGGGFGRGGPQGQPNKTFIFKQTANEMQITNKGARNGQDEIESFKLDEKEKRESIDTFGGKKVTRVTKFKLGKDNFTVTTKTPSAFGNAETVKREFTLSKDGKTMTLKIEKKGTVPTLQKLVYNKE
jgi:hypothetical protein